MPTLALHPASPLHARLTRVLACVPVSVLHLTPVFTLEPYLTPTPFLGCAPMQALQVCLTPAPSPAHPSSAPSGDIDYNPLCILCGVPAKVCGCIAQGWSRACGQSWWPLLCQNGFKGMSTPVPRRKLPELLPILDIGFWAWGLPKCSALGLCVPCPSVCACMSLCVCFHACWLHCVHVLGACKHVRTDCTHVSGSRKTGREKRVGLIRDVSHNGPKQGISSRNQQHLVDTVRDCSGGGGH